MPVKVRCQECKTVLVAPDKAIGRAIKCKSCGNAVKVRPPGAKKKVAKKRSAKKRRPPEPTSPDQMFSNLNLGMAEHDDIQLCPSCAKEVDPEDIECPACGVNIQTGALSDEQRKRRTRKGPPPEEFYGIIWKNGWQFVKNHWGFVFKTGLLWGLSLTMVVLACFTLEWYTRTRALELRNSYEGPPEAIVYTGNYVVLLKQGDKATEMKYDGRKISGEEFKKGQKVMWKPEIAAWMSPPTYFWAFILLVFFLSFGGWAWVLSAKVVEVTMNKQKKIKRFQGDIFNNMTKGFTSVFWPIMLMYPLIWIPGVLAAVMTEPTVPIVIGSIIFAIPYLIFLPIAVVHMGQPYSYRAWLISWMLKDLMSTFVPTLFVSGLFILLVLGIPGGIAAGVALGWNSIVNFYATSVEAPVLGSMFSYSAEAADGTFLFFMRMLLLFSIGMVAGTLLCTLLAIPAVFMMRVYGLFGLYFRPDLELCFEQPPGAPGGFGARFLSMHVDLLILAMIFGVNAVIANFLRGYFSWTFEQNIADYIGIGAFALLSAVAYTIYFSSWESGSGRATLGKWSIDLIVLQDDNSPMSSKLASKRAWATVVSAILAFVPFIICAFRPDKKAMQDTMTGTKVVWRGDQEA